MPMKISTAIIRYLGKKKDWASTKEIANNIGVAWSTALMYLYQLKADGVVEEKKEKFRGGVGYTRMWRLVE